MDQSVADHAHERPQSQRSHGHFAIAGPSKSKNTQPSQAQFSSLTRRTRWPHACHAQPQPVDHTMSVAVDCGGRKQFLEYAPQSKQVTLSTTSVWYLGVSSPTSSNGSSIGAVIFAVVLFTYGRSIELTAGLSGGQLMAQDNQLQQRGPIFALLDRSSRFAYVTDDK